MNFYKFSPYAFAFLMGYFIYSLLEITGRGYTHWTMSLTGGIVLALLYRINQLRRMNLLKRCFIGAFMITCIELCVGIFDNIIMKWQVWDYSDLALNFMGQICPLFSAGWFLICIPAFGLCRIINTKFSVCQKSEPGIQGYQ